MGPEGFAVVRSVTSTVIIARALLFILRHVKLGVAQSQVNYHRDQLLTIPGTNGKRDW